MDAGAGLEHKISWKTLQIEAARSWDHAIVPLKRGSLEQQIWMVAMEEKPTKWKKQVWDSEKGEPKAEPGQEHCWAGACLGRAQHSCAFAQAKNFSLLPNKFHLHILQGSCSIETLQSDLIKCLANKFKPICSCLESECHRLTFAVRFLFLSRRKSSLEGKNCTVQTLQWIN